jgi:rhodanese-related sulfurtransferase
VRNANAPAAAQDSHRARPSPNESTARDNPCARLMRGARAAIIGRPGRIIERNYHMAKHSPKFVELVDDVRKRIKETNVDEVKQRMDRGDRKFVLVDVREESEWAKGRLPGAIHLGKGIIERDIEAKVPDPNQEIILYCGGGYRSALAAENLQKMGYTNVKSMDGGWRGWTEKNHPIQRD